MLINDGVVARKQVLVMPMTYDLGGRARLATLAGSDQQAPTRCGQRR